MLTVKNLDLKVGPKIIQKDVRATWPKASLIGILGPNGCGKSTLLNHICGLSLTKKQKIFLNDEDVFFMKPLRRASLIASISQDDEAEPETIAQDRIVHGLFARQSLHVLKPLEIVKKVEAIATRLGIIELLNRPLGSLSQGQRKKVHLARGLVDDEAQIFILDEPDAHLDTESQHLVMRLLHELCLKDKLVIASLHNQILAKEHCGQIFSFPQGVTTPYHSGFNSVQISS